MKKVISLFLLCIMLLSLVGCSSEPKSEDALKKWVNNHIGNVENFYDYRVDNNYSCITVKDKKGFEYTVNSQVTQGLFELGYLENVSTNYYTIYTKWLIEKLDVSNYPNIVISYGKYNQDHNTVVEIDVIDINSSSNEISEKCNTEAKQFMKDIIKLDTYKNLNIKLRISDINDKYLGSITTKTDFVGLRKETSISYTSADVEYMTYTKNELERKYGELTYLNTDNFDLYSGYSKSEGISYLIEQDGNYLSSQLEILGNYDIKIFEFEDEYYDFTFYSLDKLDSSGSKYNDYLYILLDIIINDLKEIEDKYKLEDVEYSVDSTEITIFIDSEVSTQEKIEIEKEYKKVINKKPKSNITCNFVY